MTNFLWRSMSKPKSLTAGCYRFQLATPFWIKKKTKNRHSKKCQKVGGQIATVVKCNMILTRLNSCKVHPHVSPQSADFLIYAYCKCICNDTG